jgi:hypothetical protein
LICCIFIHSTIVSRNWKNCVWTKIIWMTIWTKICWWTIAISFKIKLFFVEWNCFLRHTNFKLEE